MRERRCPCRKSDTEQNGGYGFGSNLRKLNPG